MSKRNLALLLLLLLQVVVIGFINRPGINSAPARVAFWEGVKVEQITGLSMLGSDGRSIILNKGEQGWTIASADHLPVDPQKMKQALGKLTALASDHLVTRTPASHNRFQVGVNRFNQQVTLLLADGGKKSLFLGTSPSYKSVHVRAAGDDLVYLVKDFSTWQVPLEESGWWQSRYLDLAEETLSEVRVVNRHGELVLRKGQDNGWQLDQVPAGKTADPGKVQELVNKLDQLNLTEYLGRDDKEQYDLLDPVAVLTLVGKDEKVVLAVGALDSESKTLVIKSSASPFYVRASSFTLNPLLEATVASLLRDDKEKDATGK
ncbi:MAG TPA: DUF4340 domain-containing protein [Deltaproteobacteria bacterium]|nr:DUF4340 domain-containing protein [Deltaproteobacteria bacterium]